MKRQILILILTTSLNFVAACTSLKEGLIGSEHENVLPFAEQTVNSLGGEKLDFRESEFAYLRVLYDEEADPLSTLSEQLRMADDFRSGIVEYSVELLRVAEMSISEEKQVQEYAELEREEAEVVNGLTVARLQVVVWARAHQAMADGVKDPGNWLELALQAAESTKRVLTL
jgi:hypothetical protein